MGGPDRLDVVFLAFREINEFSRLDRFLSTVFISGDQAQTARVISSADAKLWFDGPTGIFHGPSIALVTTQPAEPDHRVRAAGHGLPA